MQIERKKKRVRGRDGGRINLNPLRVWQNTMQYIGLFGPREAWIKLGTSLVQGLKYETLYKSSIPENHLLCVWQNSALR